MIDVLCIAYLLFGESIIALRSTATPLGLHVILRSLHPTIWNQNNTFWFTHCETLLFALRKSGARMCVRTGIACAECLRGIKHFMQLAGVLLRYSDNLITVVLPAEGTSLHINCLLINRYHEPKEKGLKKEQNRKRNEKEYRLPWGRNIRDPSPDRECFPPPGAQNDKAHRGRESPAPRPSTN